jgi:hypothetical protein
LVLSFHSVTFEHVAGLNTVESSFTNSELQQRGLQILQACGDKSSIGCAKIEQKFKVSCKSNSITGILSL